MSRRLLWVQPGVPDADFDFADGNLAVAAGYVLGYTRQQGLLPGVEAAIMDQETATFAGDAALLAAVLERRPDILCGTAYVWNAERLRWLAGQIRARRPETLVVLGGPEMVPGSPWWSDPTADAVVCGEGETGLPWALAALRQAGPRPAPIHAPLLESLGELADPYSTGTLPVGMSGNCFVETIRGCPYHCHYCFYSKQFQRPRFHDPARIRAFFEWAGAREGVRDIYLLDPSFEAGPDLARRLVDLAAWNHRGIPLHTEVRPEGIGGALAAAFARAGFRSVEVGLQSIKPEVCAGVGRRLQLDKFRTGVLALREAGVTPEIGIILGLPDDDLAGFSETLAWLAGEGLADETEVFILSLLPGTELRERALREGWRFMKRPPYHLLAGREWDESRLLEGLYRVEETLGRSHYVDLPPYFQHPPDTSFRIVLPVDAADGGSPAALARAIPELASVVTLEIRTADLRRDLPRIRTMGKMLCRECPFGQFRLVLFTPAPVGPAEENAIRSAFTVSDQYWNRLNYLRDDPSGVYSCRLYQFVPADRWRDWLPALPETMDPVFELPASPEEFLRLDAAVRDFDHPGGLYLLSRCPVPLEYRIEIEPEVPQVFTRWIERTT